MNLNEIIELVNEHEQLREYNRFAKQFLNDRKDNVKTLTIHSGGAEFDLHPHFIVEFMEHILTYVSKVDTRMSSIQKKLEE